MPVRVDLGGKADEIAYDSTLISNSSFLHQCFPSSLPNKKESSKEPNDVKGIEAGIVSSNPVDKEVTLKGESELVVT